jgi:DNA-directed RNA polymerase specialized sigma24 family protein
MQISWNQEIRKHQHHLLVFLLSKGVRLHDAKDLAHETWADLMTRHREGELAHLKLPGLAFQHALFLLSKARRIQGRLAFELPESASLESIEQRVSAKQLLAVCAREIQSFSPRQQMVFSASFEHCGSDKEKASGLDLSLQRFRQIVCETRARLRAKLAEVSK